MTTPDAAGAPARHPLDEGFAPLLDLLNAPGARRTVDMTPPEARESFRLLNALAGPGIEGIGSLDRTIPGPAGEIPVRILTPEGVDPVGILVWYHGGGFVIGDLDTADDMTRRLAAAEDCRAALAWVAEHRAELAHDGAPLAVGGDSAGGNLAAVTAQRAAAEGGPALAAQLLVYPAVDFDTDGTTYPSYGENGQGYFLTVDTMRWFGAHYLGPDGDPTDPAVAPIRATDEALAATPPAIVHVAGYDPLRDEGRAYARRLAGAGVAVDLREYPGMIHGFYGMVSLTPVAAQAITDAAASLARLLTDAA